jgi:hypothetical protein
MNPGRGMNPGRSMDPGRAQLRGLADESGRALVEQAILLATLLGVLVVGSLWLMRTHPEMIHAIDVQVRGFYFVLSLPFP